MNKVRSFSMVTGAFCVICMLFGFALSGADAGEYLGDFCWSYSNTTLGASGILKLGISHMGGDHYTCSGVVTLVNPISMQFPTYGNIELLQGKIYITLSFAGIRDGVIGADTVKAVLGPDLNGTFESIGVYADAVEISEGTVTSTTCP